MSDRTRGFIVTLDKERRVDDCEESIILAIKMIKGVVSVEPIVTRMPESTLAYFTARDDLRKQIIDVLWPDREKTA